MHSEKEFVGYFDGGMYIEYTFKCIGNSPFHYDNTDGMLVRRVNGEGMRMLRKDENSDYMMCLLVEWFPTGDRFWIPQDMLSLIEE